MLAYVFWHWQYPHIEQSDYEERLINFHKTLQIQKPEGFQSSIVLRASNLPWTGGDSEAYEDWYLVENSAGLDPLDQAAVSGFRREPHDQVAQWAAGGTGGLYRLRAGEPDLATIQSAFWFAKPAGMSYEGLYALLEHSIGQTPGMLWQRQMTLGPALEFCWHTSQGAALPPELHALQVPLTVIWRG
jgi:hypothetical protein